jgi:hypothetical protein
MAKINQVFPSAPMGRRVIAPLVVVAAVLFAAVAVNSLLVVRKMPAITPYMEKAVVSLAPLVALPIVFGVFISERSRTSQFSIEENCLVLGRKRFPLEGLVDASRDPHVMRWAVKRFGNDGLGAIRGRFWSKRVGSFYAFLTSTENAVVLRWPDKVVAVSPADPDFFIYSARSAAGLKK